MKRPKEGNKEPEIIVKIFHTLHAPILLNVTRENNLCNLVVVGRVNTRVALLVPLMIYQHLFP